MSLLLDRERIIGDLLLTPLGQARPVKPGKTYPQGRTCERWGCITQLSIYNEGPQCWIHQPRRSGA